MGGFLGGIFNLVLGMGKGAISMLFAGVQNIVGMAANAFVAVAKTGWESLVQYKKESISFSRQLGMSLQESKAYSEVLIDRASALGYKYGIAAEKVMELQKNLSEATGRAMMLNNEDAEKYVQYNKLIGSDTTNKFTSTITKNLGGQLQTVEGAISKAYATAAKSGLNAAQFSQKVADNLSLANKLSFRNGIDGITKMTALSEKLGFNLQSVEAAANNFSEIDKAIENSAHMQMLGGAAGAYGSNPLTMAYEANYDPEAFTERMTKTLGGYATFDAAKGVANVNGMNRDFVKNIAQTMGISMDEAMTIAKKQAEVKYKESQFSPQLSAYGDEFKDFITNRSYVKDGKLMITDSKGNARTVGGNGKDAISAEELRKMQQFEGMSDSEIMQQQAQTLTSIDEQMVGLGTKMGADAAKELAKTGVYKKIQKGIDSAVPILTKINQWISGIIGKGITYAINWLENNKDTVKNVLHAVATVVKVIGNYGKEIAIGIGALVAVIGGWKLARHFINLGKGGTKVVKTVRTIGGAAMAAGRKTVSFTKGIFSPIKRGAVSLGKGIGKIGSTIWNGTKTLGTHIGNGAIRLGSGIKSAATTIGSAAKSGASSISRGLGKAASTIWNGTKTLGTHIGNGITSIGTSLKKSLSSLSSAAKNLSPKNILKPTKEKIKEIGAYGKTLKRETVKGYSKGGIKNFLKPKNIKNLFKGVASSTSKTGFRGVFTNKEIGAAALRGGKTLGRIAKSGGFGLVAMAAEMGGDYLANKGTIKKGGVAHTTTKVVGRAAEYAGMGGMIGSVIPGVGTAVGAAIGGVVGAGMGLKDSYNAWKEDPKNANKGFMDWGKEQLKTVGQTFVNSGKWIGNKASAAFSWIGKTAAGTWKGIKLITSTVFKGIAKGASSAWGFIKKVFNVWLTGVKTLFKVVTLPYRALYNVLKSLTNITKTVSNIKKDGIVKGTWKTITGQYATGGIIGGTSYHGDHLTAKVNSGEMILNTQQQKKLFDILNSKYDLKAAPIKQTTIQAKPVGNKEYIYKPSSNSSASNNKTITVKDINVNINGTIKIDGGGNSQNVDVRELLRNSEFVSSLKEMIKNSINTDMNGGRFVGDVGTQRGMVSSTSLWGRK